MRADLHQGLLRLGRSGGPIVRDGGISNTTLGATDPLESGEFARIPRRLDE